MKFEISKRPFAVQRQETLCTKCLMIFFSLTSKFCLKTSHKKIKIYVFYYPLPPLLLKRCFFNIKPPCIKSTYIIYNYNLFFFLFLLLSHPKIYSHSLQNTIIFQSYQKNTTINFLLHHDYISLSDWLIDCAQKLIDAIKYKIKLNECIKKLYIKKCRNQTESTDNG